jgi:hypothetical protein
MRHGALPFLALNLLAATASSTCAADSDLMGAWKNQSQAYQMGVVIALATERMDLVELGPNGPAIQEGYSKCLTGQDASTLVSVVNSYLDRNPSAYTYRQWRVVAQALKEMCDPYMPKRRPPK